MGFAGRLGSTGRPRGPVAGGSPALWSGAAAMGHPVGAVVESEAELVLTRPGAGAWAIPESGLAERKSHLLT